MVVLMSARVVSDVGVAEEEPVEFGLQELRPNGVRVRPDQLDLQRRNRPMAGFDRVGLTRLGIGMHLLEVHALARLASLQPACPRLSRTRPPEHLANV